MIDKARKSSKPNLAVVSDLPQDRRSPVEDTINQFMAVARLHGLDNVVLMGTNAQGGFQYLFQAPNPLAMVGVMERVKSDLIDRSRA